MAKIEIVKTPGLINPTQPRNFYDLLEVSPRASIESITATYRVLIDVFGPGKPGANERVAKALNEAYETLANPAKREIYDKERKDIKGQIVGEFRVLEFIAQGALGKTYKGEHILTGMPVCIKHCFEVSPQREEIFIQETKAMWDLRHYSIPTVKGLEKLEDGSLALVMSYIPGLTLKQIVEKVGRLGAEHVAWIAERILNPLKYIHYNGTVHGDIKPHNIIIEDKKHTIVIVDFGLSMVKPVAKSENKGYTPLYSAPEQIAGSVLLPESDLYSLGMTMIYALGGDTKAVERKEVPEDTPGPLCNFIKRLIVRDPLSRPQVWEKEDLCDTIVEVRKQCFGRTRSGMKPIPGL